MSTSFTKGSWGLPRGNNGMPLMARRPSDGEIWIIDTPHLGRPISVSPKTKFSQNPYSWKEPLISNNLVYRTFLCGCSWIAYGSDCPEFSSTKTVHSKPLSKLTYLKTIPTTTSSLKWILSESSFAISTGIIEVFAHSVVLLFQLQHWQVLFT